MDRSPSDNKVAIVTGASGGIGEAVARRLAQEGMCVLLAARREERLQELARAIQADGGQALAVAADVRRHADVEHIVGVTMEKWGRVDVLVNNAGVSYDRPLISMDVVQVEEEVQVNLLAAIECTRAALKPMLTQRSGHIINIASIAGLIGLPGATVYNATKYGLIGFSEGLDREVRRYGVRVSAFCPYFVSTGLIPRLNETQERALKKREIPGVLSLNYVAQKAAWLAAHPRRRFIVPPIFNLIVWAAQTFPWGADWLINRFT